MAEAAIRIPKERRPRDATRLESRTAILDAARRVAARDGARDMSLRGVAAEAGFAPAALYGYFRSKDELLLALAAEDLSVLARTMREAGGAQQKSLAGVSGAALNLLKDTETMAAVSAALASTSGGDAERLFNG